MSKFIVPDHKGECHIGGSTYYYSKVDICDAADIAELYRQTKIDKSNYREKLDPSSPRCFGKKGGMFIVLNEEEIAAEIAKEHNFWSVYRTEEGIIAGSFWFSLENEAYAGTKYEHMPCTVYPREIVVSQDCGGKNLAKAMYYTTAETMLRAGYTTGVGDLYKVVGYDDGGIVKLDMVNMPSKRAMEAIGAEFAGPLPVKELVLDGIKVYIEAQMYLFYYENVVKNCEKYFAQNDITVVRG